MKDIDIIIPVHNEQDCISLVFHDTVQSLENCTGWSYCFYFIDDGSTDTSLNEIKDLVYRYGSAKVKYVSFSRQFGKEAAIYAGLQMSQGDAVALMDADEQDPPAVLPHLIDGLTEGFDAVAVVRSDRHGEPKVRSWLSVLFYRLLSISTNIVVPPNARDCRVMTSQMRDAVLLLAERERFSKGLLSWVGFRTKWVEQPNSPRIAGSSKWSTKSLLRYSLTGITSFTTAPLRFIPILGLLCICLSFVYGLYGLAKYGPHFSGDLMLIFIGILGYGTLLILLGIIGTYLASVLTEVKARPPFLIRETNVVPFVSTNRLRSQTTCKSRYQFYASAAPYQNTRTGNHGHNRKMSS